MDTPPKEDSCPNCMNRTPFQPIANLKELGVIIMRYVADVVNQDPHPKNVLSESMYDPKFKSNVFIIINTNNTNLSSEDILPKFDINKVTCPRCRQKAENVQKMLRSKIYIGRGDIMGICDHCKNQQIPKEPCEICEDIVKKFLGSSEVKTKTEKSLFEPHVHRPLISERLARIDEKFQLRKAKEKATADLDIDLKYIMRPESEIYKPAHVPEKPKLTKVVKIEQIKDTPRFSDFPSDESIVTPFVTTFSKGDKKVKDFKYIFPRDVEKEEELSKAALTTSSELIMDIQTKARKPTEDKEKEKYHKITLDETVSTHEEVTRKPWDKVKEVEYNIYSKKEPSVQRENKLKTLKEIPSSSVSEASKKSKKKEIREEVGKDDKEKIRKTKSEITIREVTEPQRSKVTSARELKGQSPEMEKIKKSQEDVRKPPSKDVKKEVGERDEVEKPPPKETPKAVKDKTDKEDVEQPRSKDIKPKKQQEDLEPPITKETKSKKEQNIAAPLSSPNITAKKSKEVVKPPKPAKEGQAKKVQEDMPSPPTREKTKEVKAKKVEEEEKLPAKDVKVKKGKEEEPLTPKEPPKERKAKKEKDDVGPPTPKEVKAKKEKEDVGPPAPKDAKAKKGKEDVGIPPPPPKEPKAKKDKEEAKEVRTKKLQEDVEPPPSKDIKGKKGKDELGPSPKVIKSKLSREDLGPKPSKDVKTKKSQVLAGPPPPPPPPKKSPKKGKEDEVQPSPKEKKVDKIVGEPSSDSGKEMKKNTKKVEDVSKKDTKIGKIQDEKIDTRKDQERRGKDNTKEREQDKKVAKVKGIEKEKEKEKEKEEIAKDEEVKAEKGKGKGKKEKEKEREKEEKPKEKTVPEKPFDIIKLLPIKSKDTKLSVKALDPKAAAIEAERRMKELQSAALEKARSDAAKRFALPEMHGGEYYLFKLAVVVPPPDVEKPPKRKKLKEFDLKQLKLRSPSIDDLVLKMIKLNKAKKEKDKKTRKLQGKYKIRSARRAYSFGSFSIDSDFELALESLTNLLNAKVVRYKIKHINIVRDVLEKPKHKLQPDPILFHAVHDESEPLQVFDLEEESLPEVNPALGKGIIRYMLSDRSFIEKGWTVLPTEKVVRQMNIYKVRPAHPEYDWFYHNRTKGQLTYETGERMAQFDEDGRGRWYYMNGRLALDYYDCEDSNAQQRFVIYSDGEPSEQCRTLPVTVLAMFDYLGNGVVFDHNGKIRVKYNQTEGVILDRDIGPFTRWKWHTLNDPPVLKQVMIDTYAEPPDPKIMRLGRDDIDKTRVEDEEMLAIELDNFVHEKAKKLKQKFQACQIRMKALRINEQFSLKILDQARIYLHFRHGSANIRLNLGMILDNQEIIDTETADFVDVANVLERIPPKTESILELQNALRQTRQNDRLRSEYALKIRPIVPICSADKLVSAISKPLRPPLKVVQDSNVNYAHRKPSQANLYYDTRLI